MLKEQGMRQVTSQTGTLGAGIHESPETGACVLEFASMLPRRGRDRHANDRSWARVATTGLPECFWHTFLKPISMFSTARPHGLRMTGLELAVRLGRRCPRCPVCGTLVRADDARGLTENRLAHAECVLLRWLGDD